MSVSTTAPVDHTSRRPGGRLLDLATTLTTPLLPDDYLALVNPLWSSRELRVRVEQVVPETADAATLVLRPGRGWASHVAGQWIRLGVRLDGVLHWRCYSLTCPPRADGTIRVTVKAMPDGFVSRHLVHELEPRTVLRLAAAAGDFVLPVARTAPLLFVTAGSGITPVMGMLRSLVEEGDLPDAVLVHSAPTADDVIFGAELRALAAQHRRFSLVERHTDVDGLLTIADLARAVPDWREREAWACGPAGLLDAVEDHWASAGLRRRLHTERFRPKVLAGSSAEGGDVCFSRTGTATTADGATALLDAGEDAGVLMPSGCRMGICFSCVVPLLEGQVRDLRTGEVHGELGDLVQTCVSAAAGPVSLDL